MAVGTGLDVAGQENADGVVAGHDANIRQLAANLFGDNVFVFELTSVLLIVAVAGTVVLDTAVRGPASGAERRDDGAAS